MSLSISQPNCSCAADGSGGIAEFTLTITKSNFSGSGYYGDFSLQTLDGTYVQGRQNYPIYGSGGTGTQAQRFVGLDNLTYQIMLREYDDRGQVISTTTRGFGISCTPTPLTGEVLDQGGTTTTANNDGFIKVQASGGYPPLQATIVELPGVAALALLDGQPASFTNLPGRASAYTVRFTDSKQPAGQRVEKPATVRPYVAPVTPSDPCEGFALATITTTPPTLGKADGKILVTTTGGGGATVIIRVFQDDGTGTLVQFDRTAQYAASLRQGAYERLPAGLYTVTLSLDARPASCTITQLNNRRLDVDILPPDLEIGDQLTFLPWVQPQLANAASGTTLALRATLATDPAAAGATTSFTQETETVAALTARITGPGEVLGIAQRAILGTTPVPNATGFSPLQLAAIEFQDEDLPWRYSTQRRPAYVPRLGGQDQDAQDAAPLPWLFLLVLKAGEFTAQPLTGPLPSIAVAATAPYPAVGALANGGQQQELWAHVQSMAPLGYAGDDTTLPKKPPTAPSAQELDTFLNKTLPASPDLAYARILSPRRLEANTAYTAFLLPSLEVGRLAGLGRPTAGVSEMASAIPAAPGAALDFPVYFQWQFSTGTEEDFETLVAQLGPGQDATTQAAPATLAIATNAGTSTLPMPALLRDAHAPVPSAAAAVEAVRPAANFLFSKLEPGFTLRYPAGGRPVLAPPLYGRAYMLLASLQAPTTAEPIADSWKHQVNLDPRYRALAALGAQVVRDNQEEYVRRAWEQVQDLLLANDKLRGAQYGLRTTAGLRDQHLPLATITTTTTTTTTGAAAGGNQLAGSPRRYAASSADDASSANDASSARAADYAAPDTGTADAPASLTLAADADQPAALTTTTTGTATSVGMADYGLHLTGLALSRVRLPVAGAPTRTVRETIRRSSTPLAAFSPTFRRLIKPFGNYVVGQAGRPLRPTQPEGPAPAAPTLRERGTSLRQRDGLLTGLAQGRLAAAPAHAEQARVLQFADDRVDALLKAFNKQAGNAALTATALGDDSGAQARFRAAFGGFLSQKQPAGADERRVGFRRPQYVRPALPLPALLTAVVTGTAPGPLFLKKIEQVAPAVVLPPAVPLPGGDYEGTDFNASHFYVADDLEEPSHLLAADWLAGDFDGADFRTAPTVVYDADVPAPAYPSAGGAPPLLAATARFGLAPVAEASADGAALTSATNATSTDASTDATSATTSTTDVRSTATSAAPPATDGTLPAIKQAKVIPVFKDPMGEPLRKLHPELFVPGLGELPANSVSVLEVNQAFIEAYMVGLNHALGSELSWRGFPVDLRGTFFQQFWDVSEHLNAGLPAGQLPTHPQEAAVLDINPLDKWTYHPLGTNTLGAYTTPAPAQPTLLRLAVRSELLARYPTLVLALQLTARTGDSAAHDPADPDSLLLPRQRLAVGQDVAIVTFEVPSLATARADYSLLLMERPGQPKFGFDQDAPAPPENVPPTPAPPANADPLSWDDLAVPYLEALTPRPGPGQNLVFYAAGTDAKPHVTAEPRQVAYLTDSARVAYALFQEPILASVPLQDILA